MPRKPSAQQLEAEADRLDVLYERHMEKARYTRLIGDAARATRNLDAAGDLIVPAISARFRANLAAIMEKQ